jgi:hypothetical protein
MAIRVSTGGLKRVSEEKRKKIENKLLQAVVSELGKNALPPDWTQITFSRIGPPHTPAKEKQSRQRDLPPATPFAQAGSSLLECDDVRRLILNQASGSVSHGKDQRRATSNNPR